MPQELLRPALRIGVLVAGLAVVTLPFQPSGSAEFVVTVLAAIVGIVFVAGVALLARTAAPPRPVKGYNKRSIRRDE